MFSIQNEAKTFQSFETKKHRAAIHGLNWNVSHLQAAKRESIAPPSFVCGHCAVGRYIDEEPDRHFWMSLLPSLPLRARQSNRSAAKRHVPGIDKQWFVAVGKAGNIEFRHAEIVDPHGEFRPTLRIPWRGLQEPKFPGRRVKSCDAISDERPSHSAVDTHHFLKAGDLPNRYLSLGANAFASIPMRQFNNSLGSQTNLFIRIALFNWHGFQRQSQALRRRSQKGDRKTATGVQQEPDGLSVNRAVPPKGGLRGDICQKERSEEH